MSETKHTSMTKSQIREAINGLGPLAPDWLVEALEDFIKLQESHEILLTIHAEDAYHLDALQYRVEELEAQLKNARVEAVSELRAINFCATRLNQVMAERDKLLNEAAKIEAERKA